MIRAIDMLNELAIVTNKPGVLYLKYEYDAKINAVKASVASERFTENEFAEFDIHALPADEVQYQLKTQFVSFIEKNATDIFAGISRRLPPGKSKAQYYTEIAEEAFSSIDLRIYSTTTRFVASHYLISTNILPLLASVNVFDLSENTRTINGPYLAGQYRGKDVYVCPTLAPGSIIGFVKEPDNLTGAVATHYNLIDDKLMFAMKCLDKGLIAKITILN